MIRTTIRETLSERKQSVLSLSNDSGVRYPTLTEFINTGKGISIDNLEKVLSSLDLVIVDSKSVEALSGELKKLL